VEVSEKGTQIKTRKNPNAFGCVSNKVYVKSLKKELGCFQALSHDYHYSTGTKISIS
jgi:hypothetical protein